MNWRRLPVVILFCLFFPALAQGVEADKTGIVKGTVTIGGRPTSDVVVSVEGLPEKLLKSQRTEKPMSVIMDQRDKKFIPHVLAVRLGATVAFPNNDKTWHNIYSTSVPKKFDLGLYPPGKSRKLNFDKPGVVRIRCNVHPNMEAFIVVEGHPYFSAADREGNYRVNSVPVGKYRLEIWHPDLGKKIVPFDLVRGGEVLDINVDLKEK
ncbi:MAG: carboxypeptidase regulatory-like domain-containing protein [Candidatus Binatia bacterium]